MAKKATVLSASHWLPGFEPDFTPSAEPSVFVEASTRKDRKSVV